MEQRYTVTQTVELLGIKSYVLRYWEEELGLSIHRNEQGHRYYTGYDITLFANIRELKNRGLQLRAIKEVLPKISPMASELKEDQDQLQIPGKEQSVRESRKATAGSEAAESSRESEREVDWEKLQEFERILERLIQQELERKTEGEDKCRDLDAAIRSRQLARKEAAAALEKTDKKRKKHMTGKRKE